MRIRKPDAASWPFLVIAVVVTVAWIIVLSQDSDELTGINIAFVAVITGACNLATKPDKGEP